MTMTIQRLVRESSKTLGYKTNDFGIKLLPENLRNVLFKHQETKISNDQKYQALGNFKKFKLSQSSQRESQSQRHVQLPRLYGDIESHFWKIGQQQVDPYLQLLRQLFSVCQFPQKPENWVFQPGWTRYDPDTGLTEAVGAPLEHVFCFDVEVCVQDGDHPVLATALTTHAWYSWCSPYLISGKKPSNHVLQPSDLIILTGKYKSLPRLVIGHNVCYDRARSSDEYEFKDNCTQFLDTMSLHIVVSGMSSEQRMIKLKDKDKPEQSGKEMSKQPKWFNETSLNNLNDVYQHYCKGEPLKKTKRDVFIKGSMLDIQRDFQELMTYCADDVIATNSLIKTIFPIFQQRCPHPVTLAGMLELGKCFMPISKRWDLYVSQSDDLCNEWKDETEQVLGNLARETVQLGIEDKHKEDLWMWDQDWTTSFLKVKKQTKKSTLSFKDPNIPQEKFYELFRSITNLYLVQSTIPGYPAWFEDLATRNNIVWSPDITGLTSSKKIVPKLLRLRWMEYPLHHHEKMKWGYIVPKESDSGIIDDTFCNEEEEEETILKFPTSALKSELNKNTSPNFDSTEASLDIEDDVSLPPIDFSAFQSTMESKNKEVSKGGKSLPEMAGCEFYRLPHKDGEGKNVGNPLSKEFFNKIKEDILTTELGALASKVLISGKVQSYWKSSKDRIRQQMRVTSKDGYDVILPQLVPCGTLTRRAVERTWLTASNARQDRVGSELKTLVEAPKGYRLVGADVDSQELWIAAVLGDSHFAKEHGSTPLGWMTLQGNKNDGTDVHSVTARTVGVSRDNAKILNYGRIYGAGATFAKHLLQRFNPKLDEEQANKLAYHMYSQTKGVKTYILNKTGAICYAGYMSCKEKDHSTDFMQFVDLEINRKELFQVVKIKRMLDMYFEQDKNKPDSWVPNESAKDLMLELCDGYCGETTVSLEQAFSLIKNLGTKFQAKKSSTSDWHILVNKVTSRNTWKDGSESQTFNRLEDIALDWNTKTPILGCKITRALQSEVVGLDYMPSRVNWVVQSSAVDYLHLLLVCMKWLIKEYKIEARFVISIHDEVRYMVKEEDCLRGALALQMANLMVRAMFCSKLGMSNLPENVAYFSGVDIDQVMRKDPDSECVTPSNPQGLSQGWGIPKGESLTIGDIIERIGNTLEKKS